MGCSNPIVTVSPATSSSAARSFEKWRSDHWPTEAPVRGGWRPQRVGAGIAAGDGRTWFGTQLTLNS